MVEEEITLTLAIDQDEELAEIRDSKDINKIEEFSKKYGFEETFTKQLIEKYKISLNLLEKIMTALSKNKKYDSITNLPYMANEVFREDYSVNLEYETILIKGYLQKYYSPNPTERVYLNTLDDRIRFFNTKSKIKLSNAEIINLYMQFIYSTLEYNIMPIVNIGLEIYDYYPHLIYGKNVIESLKACKDKY